jgi:hypothetical protein
MAVSRFQAFFSPVAGNASRWAAKNVRIIDSPLWSAEADHEGELKEHDCEGEFCT